MKTEKVMSVYNLQDEGKLSAILAGMEGLSFEKIGTMACDSAEPAQYHISMDEAWAGGQFLGSIAKFVQENEGTEIKFCNPEKAGYETGRGEEVRG